jgi:prepilin-type N-terminal cleavage/methylation domain-containing protein
VRTLSTKERFLKDERGFTLVEMIVTTMIMVFVLIGLSSIFDMSLKVTSYANRKVEAVEIARVSLEKMEREIRQAHAINTATGQMFDTWTSNEIRFGNDLDGNGVIACPNTSTPPKCERIGYRLNGTTLQRDNTATGASFQPVAERVQSLTFTYYDASGNKVSTLDDEDPAVGDEACIDRVLVSMNVAVNEGMGGPAEQALTTVIDLRNRAADECLV